MIDFLKYTIGASLIIAIMITLISILINTTIKITSLVFSRPKKKSRFIKFRKAFAYTFVLSLLAFGSSRAFFTLYRVAGMSMQPALLDGDFVLARNSRNGETYIPGTIIVYHEDGAYKLTRVIANSGSNVKINKGMIEVDGYELNQVYEKVTQITDTIFSYDVNLYSETNNVKYHILQPRSFSTNDLLWDDKLLNSSEFVVPDGKLFCLSDSRIYYRAINSESVDLTYINKDEVIGKINKIMFSLDNKLKIIRNERTLADPYQT